MKGLRLGITIILAALLLAACSDPSRSLYHGIKLRNEMGKTPEERATSPQQPSYDQYKKEREQQEH
jgi:hypothetical protein